MTTQEKLDAKLAELAEVKRKISGLSEGSVRLGFKRQRAGLTGDIVNLNQDLVAEQMHADNPIDVPMVRLGEDPSTLERQERKAEERQQTQEGYESNEGPDSELPG